MRHVIESQQFNRAFIEILFSIADGIDTPPDKPLQGKILASLFYEPSTRTRFSFESAMLRLGGSIISTENAREFSSVSKGESLEDTIQIIHHYADVIVLRHSDIGAASRASLVSDVPIINAGDGAGQHPTQALLDLYTIVRERGSIDGTKIAMVGDLKHGRTTRSLAYLLGKYQDIQIYFVSSEHLTIGTDICEYLDRHDVNYRKIQNLREVIGEVDVIYQTRIQKERFENIATYEQHRMSERIDRALAGHMKPGAIIMHPLPRVDEIALEVDTLPQAVYFKQARYGLLIRMALLKMLIGK